MDAKLADFLTSINNTVSVAECWRETSNFLADLGIDKVLYYFRMGNLQAGQTTLMSTMPASWIGHYTERGYGAIDPFFRYCCTANQLLWTGAGFLPEHDYLLPPERLLIREAGEAGFQAGIALPMHSCDKTMTGGWNLGSRFSGNEFKTLVDDLGNVLPIAALYAHQRIEIQNERHRKKTAPAEIILTTREKECLLWLASGLRTYQIAERLGIKSVTVDLHIKNARCKLNATTREQALAIALQDRLINP